MSRRLVWGDDYAGVGRQEMPTLPIGSRGIDVTPRDGRFCALRENPRFADAVTD